MLRGASGAPQVPSWLPGQHTAQLMTSHSAVPHGAAADRWRSPQVLSTRYSRNLLTLRKCRAFDEAASLASIAAQREEFTALDGIHEVVYDSKAREAEGLCQPAVKQYYRSKLV